MKTITIFLLLFVLLISCATKKEKLTFSKFIISNIKGQTEIKVEDNGTIFISDNLIGMIDKEGTIITKHGTVLAEVMEDNFIIDGEGKTLIRIDENGAVENNSGEFEWSANGELLKNDEPIGFKIFPVDKDSFQTASLLLFLHLSIK
ncbi:hypothetical protein FIA58_019415 [Flavobacterium jejuense]|uniref:Uncharacterized protein n=1 Tax=Flavobacterium jejuense TaxID=1544455 RepID=A0ABX0IYQ9_9FLAO|nr:hypothetical protein [Flavobacterium jejuense]NHN27852.1 hypothetical protein [Flavobacterium jejuense]